MRHTVRLARCYVQRSAVINFSIGFILGMFFTMFSFTLITVFNVEFDLSIWTNVVIAVATCLATAIHIDSQIKLRKNRVWEINKGILL